MSLRILVLGMLLAGAAACSDKPAEAPAEAPAVATAAPAAEPETSLFDAPLERAVTADRLPYAEVEDELVYGHFVFPSDMIDPLPAVLVIHEWWGLNDNVRAMADRIASQGYIVLAVDLFNGQTATTAEEGRALMVPVVENPEAATANIRQAHEFLQMTAGAESIGAVGWSFGGGWALNTAMLFPNDLSAAVIYYGQVSDDAERLQPVNTALLGLFAGEDRGVTADAVSAFEATLTALRKPYEVHVYPDANHHFANPTHRNFDADAAEDAWGRMTEFLARHLVTAETDSATE